MNILRYLRDKLGLLIIYIINIVIINMTIILDENIPMNIDNVFYMDVLSLFIIVLYLIFDYRKYNNIYKKIENKVKNHYFEQFDISNSMPYLEKIYYQLFNEYHENVDKSKKQLTKDNDDYHDFITTWVHAVKIPISASRLLIESNHDNVDTKDTLVNIENEIDKIERYVEQSLYYSRSMSFSKDYIIQEYKLNNIVNKVIKKFAKTFIGKKISLNIDIDDNIGIHTDKKWFEFILEQLISNSLKYTDAEGEINISSYEDQREYRLLIKDNGIGIKIEDINRVFERGFTGYNGRYYEKSTGMGLYLARKLAKKLGHKITIESRSKEYTLVGIHISKVGDYFLK